MNKYHIGYGKITKISESGFIYFESIPNIKFFYNEKPTINVGSYVVVTYREVKNYTKDILFIVQHIEQDEEFNENYKRNVGKHLEMFTVTCHCNNKLNLTNSKQCKGSIYKNIFNENLCSVLSITCDKCTKKTIISYL